MSNQVNITEEKTNINKTFDGPIDLLLSLIEKRKLQINTLSLSKITNDYLEKLKKQAVFPSQEVACFVHTASILLFIKSRSLLPILSYLDEEETDAEVLEKRLILYKMLKNASAGVEDNFKKQNYFCPNPIKKQKTISFNPDKKMDLKMISTIAENLIFILPKKKDLKEKVVDIVVTLDEMMDNLVKKIHNLKITGFFGQIADRRTKKTFAVSFLALLELVKQNKISVSQTKLCGEIKIKK